MDVKAALLVALIIGLPLSYYLGYRIGRHITIRRLLGQIRKP